VVVGEECSGGSGCAAGFVVPDRGGERKESLQDASADAFGFAAAVTFLK